MGDGFICGGSIRRPDRIVTAAHCVTNAANMPLPAGTFEVGYGSDSRDAQTIVGVSNVSVPAAVSATRRRTTRTTWRC